MGTPPSSTREHIIMQRRMLTKEDEAATGGDEVEVRREDQDKINKFSRLHQREIALEEELKTKHKEKRPRRHLKRIRAGRRGRQNSLQNRRFIHLVTSFRSPRNAGGVHE